MNLAMPEENSLYPGDTGELSLDIRRVLVQLLKGPALDANRYSKLWSVLLTNEVVIRSRLAELFLELIIDEEQQVSFVRQANTCELESPTLLKRTKLTFLSSVLLLYLRQLLIEAESQGERAVISEQDIIEQLMLYQQSDSTDPAGFRRKITAAIERVKDMSILTLVPNTKDRYEVSPLLKLLFGAEEVNALQTQYKQRGEAHD